jgi:hypothetical protein
MPKASLKRRRYDSLPALARDYLGLPLRISRVFRNGERSTPQSVLPLARPE